MDWKTISENEVTASNESWSFWVFYSCWENTWILNMTVLRYEESMEVPLDASSIEEAIQAAEGVLDELFS